MTDDEVIETFLKENEIELRKSRTRARVRAFFHWWKPVAIGFVVAFCLTVVLLYVKHRIAAHYAEYDANEELEKHIQDTHRKEKEAVEYAAAAKRDHQEAQYAYITVQYALDGHAVGCWVTQHKNDVISFTDNGMNMVAYSFISNYKDYVEYGSIMRYDPKMCIVWHWNGQDQ